MRRERRVPRRDFAGLRPPYPCALHDRSHTAWRSKVTSQISESGTCADCKFHLPNAISETMIVGVRVVFLEAAFSAEKRPSKRLACREKYPMQKHPTELREVPWTT